MARRVFAPSFKGAGLQTKQGSLAWTTTTGISGAPYNAGWDMNRAVATGLLMNSWVFRAVDAIASNQAGLPFMVRKGEQNKGLAVKTHPLLPLFNQFPNDWENSWEFRYRLSSQLLLSKMGAFIEIQRSRGGDVIAMFLLNCGTVSPIPDKDTFVKGYVIQTPTERVTVPPEQICWIKLPHPTDPYSGLTPLEAAGLAVDSDIYARMFNRNFLLNDGRPGGILAIKGGMEEGDAERLKMKFQGPGLGQQGYLGAGRLTVLETGDDGVDFVDTATTPRDAQYKDMREGLKTEILIAFGVPEAVIGNASGRTYDNAGVENEVFWRETMLPHLSLISRGLDRLAGDNLYPAFDTSSIYILDRDKREQHKFYLQEFQAGAISAKTYLDKTGQDSNVSDDNRYINGQMVQYQPDGEPVAPPAPPEVPDHAHPELTTPPAAHNGNGSTPPAADEEAKPPAATDDQAPRRGRGRGHLTPVSASVEDEVAPETKSDCRHLRIDATSGRRICKDCDTDLGEQPPVRALEAQPIDLTIPRRMAAWEKHGCKQLEGYFRRQERVVIEKLLSKRNKERWADGEPILAQDIFDSSRWDQQLADDTSIWLGLLAEDFGVAESPDVLASVVAENGKTMGFVTSALMEGAQARNDIEALASKVRSVFTGAVHGRTPQIASRVVRDITRAKETSGG